MDTREIRDAWLGLMNCQRSSLAGGGFLDKPVCGTCKHWRLITGEALLQVSSPTQGYIERGIRGEVHRVMYDGTNTDTYSVQVFHGFCRRFLPATYAPLDPADHYFPLLSHEASCGEWIKHPELKNV